jgi:hypothetical protein
MSSDWTKVHVTADAYEAEIIKQALLENDMPAVVVNKQDSSYKAFGDYAVLVHPTVAEKARIFLAENNTSK